MADRENRLLALIAAATGHTIAKSSSDPDDGLDIAEDDEGITLPDDTANEEKAA